MAAHPGLLTAGEVAERNANGGRTTEQNVHVHGCKKGTHLNEKIAFKYNY